MFSAQRPPVSKYFKQIVAVVTNPPIDPIREEGAFDLTVHLGGSLGTDPGFGRKLRGLKVTADGLADYTERVLRNYLAGRAEGEQFAAWARRADEKLLV